MSQSKVDQYKEAKKHRKEEIAKAKKKAAVTKIVSWTVVAAAVIALVVGITVTFVNINKAKAEELASYYTTTSFVLGDLANIQGKN